MKSTRAHALQALLAVLCGPLSSPASVAQSDSASDVLPMEEIEITARRIGGAREVTEAVTSVTADALDDMALPVVTDALRGQTGVYVQQTTPGQGTAIVRGLKGSEVLHLVDGMRLNNALFRNAPNQYLALVDPFIAQRVDVVRGPLSTIYGSDAMGGAVQVVTDRPFLGGGDLRTAGRGVVRFDGRTLGRVAHASMWVGQGDWGGGGAISLQDHDNVRAADRRAQAPSGYRSEAASGFVSWRPSDNQRTELSFQWLNQPSTPRFDELNAGFGQSAPASEVFRFEPNARTFVHFEHDVKGLSRWLDDAWLHVGWQRISDGRRTRDTGAATTREEDNRSDLFGVTFNAAAAPFGIHDLQYGLDLYYDTVSSVRTEVDVNTGQRENIRARFPDGSTLSTADLYVHDDMTLSDDWLLTTGLRLSRTEVALAATSVSNGATIRNTELTGSFGLRHDLTERVAITANLGRGFRAPNIFDLGTLGARPGNRFNIANPDLGPETVWTVDTGIEWQGETAELNAVVWYSDYIDQITSVSTGQVDAAGRDIVQSQNASESILYGIELAAAWEITRRLTLNATVNSVYGRTTLADGQAEPADRIPPLNGQLGLRYHHGDWWLRAQWRGADDQSRLSARDVRDPRIDPLGTPGFGVINLAGGWQISPVWRATLELHNAADRAFREHGSGIDAAGRAITVSLRGAW